MTDRNVRIGLDADTIVNIAEITGNDALFSAVGYLSMWNMSHPVCEIIGGVYDGTPELVATYRREQGGPITYQIGAVWHETTSLDPLTGLPVTTGHFGFHS